MQRTANFHHQIADACLSEAADVVNDAATLDTAVDVLDPDPATCDAPIGRFLRAREGPAPRLLGGHDDLDPVQGKRQKAQVLEQPAPHRQGVRGGIGNAFIVGTARIGRTKYSSSQLSGQYQAAIAGASAMTLATDCVDQLNGCAC
jgi:hypothetical protein